MLCRSLEVFVLANHFLFLGQAIDSLHALSPGAQARFRRARDAATLASRAVRELELAGDRFKHRENRCPEMRLRFWAAVGASGLAREHNNTANVASLALDAL